MGEMQRHAARGVYGRERRRDIAGNAEIIGVQMQRMRNLEIDHRLLQALEDLARRDVP